MNVTDADAMFAVACLTERQRLAVFLVCVRRLSLRAAGKAMGISHVRVLHLLRAARTEIGFSLLAGLPDDDRAEILGPLEVSPRGA